MTKPSHSVERLDPFRHLVVDGLELAARKHCVHGLVEVDMTRAREGLRRAGEREGEAPSLTGFVAYCCARAVEVDRRLHGYLDWRGRLVVFDDVDVSLPVERARGGRAVVLQTVVRAANRKTVGEIHREIRASQATELGETPWGRWLGWYVRVPRPLRRLLFRAVQRAPALLKRVNGTVLVTSVGMFGSSGVWGIPLPGHTLSVTVGGIERKPVVVDGLLETREHLRLTVSFDHDVVDGAPAARFLERFTALVREGAGLEGPA